MKPGPAMMALSTGVAVVLATGGAARADTHIDVCGLGAAERAQTLQPELDGFWQVEMGAGVLSMQGQTIPLPPGEPDVATITSDAASMTISGGLVHDTFPLQWETRAGWNFGISEGTPLDPSDILDDEEQAILAGCPEDALPRLFAEGEYVDPESGQPVSFELYLRVISPSILYGTVVGHSGGGTAQRAVSLMR